MLGKSPEHPFVKELHTQYFPHDVYRNETTGFTCFKQEDTFYTPEELMAMIMQHIKDMTLNHAGKAIKDCVITVPSHFSYHERKALYTAANIADLRVLTLIEENTAAALHYGMDRVFDTPNTVLYYNMGSSSVQVTIVTYSSYNIKEAGKNKSIGQFEVIGKSWDSSLGGFNFDVKIAEMLAQRFNEIWGKKASGKGKDLRDFSRPMTRLRVEAVKIKEVLSANNEYPVKAEQLHADVDLITKVTRSEFETACTDLFSRITEPIDRALAMANLTLSDVNAVELLGGGVRIPKVKKLLDEYFKASKIELGQHLNGDEAMALGAAFRAANLSTAFKVRKVGQSDISVFGVSIRLETLPTETDKHVNHGLFGLFRGKKREKDVQNAESDDTAWTKNAEIFPSKYTLSSKIKTVTFPYDKDILCSVEYTDRNSLPEGTDHTIAVFNITGISKFAAEAIEKNASQPKVHLSFNQDSDGIVNLVRAEITAELPQIKNDTNVTNSDESDQTKDDKTVDDANSTNTTASTDEKPSKTKEKKDKKVTKKETVLRRSLIIDENLLATNPSQWDEKHIAESKAKLLLLQEADNARKAKEAALNDLEAYVYKVKNRIDEEKSELDKVSTKEQMNDVTKAVKEAEEWLDEVNSQKTPIEEFIAKKTSISKHSEPIFYRYSELTNRPREIKKTQDGIAQLKTKVALWAEKMPHINQNETQQMLDELAKVEAWIEKKQEEQLAISLTDTPIFKSTDVATQLKPAKALYEKLNRKLKPPPEKIKVNITNVNSTDSENSTSNESKNETESETTDNQSNSDNTKETPADEL